MSFPKVTCGAPMKTVFPLRHACHEWPVCSGGKRCLRATEVTVDAADDSSMKCAQSQNFHSATIKAASIND